MKKVLTEARVQMQSQRLQGNNIKQFWTKIYNFLSIFIWN